MLNLYTIGYTEKTAEYFFSKLKSTSAKKIIDVRLNNISQLAGFTKKSDLAFFLKNILNWEYFYYPELAPTKDILDDYKHKKITWKDYEARYLELLQKRRVEKVIAKEFLADSVLLCSEKSPECCHRRLAAEYLNRKFDNCFSIMHLV
ncbi:MAG: DUF488 family protein [Treponema sp.]